MVCHAVMHSTCRIAVPQPSSAELEHCKCRRVHVVKRLPSIA